MKPGKTTQFTGPKSPPPLILHAPHASTHIPFADGYLNEETIAREIQLLSNWYTDELFGNKGQLFKTGYHSYIQTKP